MGFEYQVNCNKEVTPADFAGIVEILSRQIACVVTKQIGDVAQFKWKNSIVGEGWESDIEIENKTSSIFVLFSSASQQQQNSFLSCLLKELEERENQCSLEEL